MDNPYSGKVSQSESYNARGQPFIRPRAHLLNINCERPARPKGAGACEAHAITRRFINPVRPMNTA